MNKEISNLERKLKNNFTIVAFIFIPIVIVISTELSINLLPFPIMKPLDSKLKHIIGYILLSLFSMVLIANIVILIKQLIALKKLNKNITEKNFDRETIINKNIYIIITIILAMIGGQNIITKNYIRFIVFTLISGIGIYISKTPINILTLIITLISFIDILVISTKKCINGKIVLNTKGVDYE